MEPANIHQDISAIWEKLIKPTYRAYIFDEVSTPLTPWVRFDEPARHAKTYTLGCVLTNPLVTVLNLPRGRDVIATIV